MLNFITDARLVKLNVLAGSGQKNIFHSRITILLALGALALGALVAAPPNNPLQPPNSWTAASPHLPLANAFAIRLSEMAKPPHSPVVNVKWRYRRSVSDPTTLSSEALELLTKRHFYEQQKTRYPCYKTFYVGKLKYFTIASLYFWRMRRIRHRLCGF